MSELGRQKQTNNGLITITRSRYSPRTEAEHLKLNGESRANMDLFQAVEKRRTVREFQSKPVEERKTHESSRGRIEGSNA